MVGWLKFIIDCCDHHKTLHNLYNIYMYNCVWSDDAWTCLFMVGGDDPIKTDENIKDCLRALELFLNIICVVVVS